MVWCVSGRTIVSVDFRSGNTAELYVKLPANIFKVNKILLFCLDNEAYCYTSMLDLKDEHFYETDRVCTSQAGVQLP